MYSEQELTTIIKAVFDQEVESGVFDEDIADYVDAYLVEHPVDPTAITGLDIAPKDVTASGNITAPSIIENMSGYSLNSTYAPPSNIDLIYVGCVKNGNKITFSIFGEFTYTNSTLRYLCGINIPSAIGSQLYPATIIGNNKLLDVRKIELVGKSTSEYEDIIVRTLKESNTILIFYIDPSQKVLDTEKTWVFRYEVTFLLSENLVSE